MYATAKALIQSNPIAGLYYSLQNLKCSVLGYILFIDEWDSVAELVPQVGHMFPYGYLIHVKEIIFLKLTRYRLTADQRSNYSDGIMGTDVVV